MPRTKEDQGTLVIGPSLDEFVELSKSMDEEAAQIYVEAKPFFRVPGNQVVDILNRHVGTKSTKIEKLALVLALMRGKKMSTDALLHFAIEEVLT